MIDAHYLGASSIAPDRHRSRVRHSQSASVRDARTLMLALTVLASATGYTAAPPTSTTEGHSSIALDKHIPSARLDGYVPSVLAAASGLMYNGNGTMASTGATSTGRRVAAAQAAETGDRTTIVILSDRFDAVVVAIGSLFRYSPDSDIDIWLIGDLERGALGNVSLLERLEAALQPQAPKQTINVMSIDEATSLLESDGVSPLWKWPQFGSQGADQDQDHQPRCVLKPEPWDYDNMHHDPFNMLRFYLPYLGPFRELETLFFADDDIVVQKDIKSLEMYMGEGTVIAATCNGWIWSEGCMRNEPYYNAANWLDYPVSYLGKDLAHNYSGCVLSASESGHRVCQSDDFGNMIMNWSQTFNGYAFDAEAQPRWNFGMSRFNLTEWRAQRMTEVFDNFMRANYEAKLVPETSLCFGLGIAYFAFADKVMCWNDLVGDPAFVDGLGYISKADIKANKLNATALLGDATVLHWSGRNKPFDPLSEMDPEIYKPFDDIWEWLEEENGIEPFGRQMIDDSQMAVRTVLYADPGSGSDWFLELLDETPDVCAAGSTGNPTAAFSRESLIPPHFEDIQNNIPICAQKRACLWSFITQNVPRYVAQYDTWCPDFQPLASPPSSSPSPAMPSSGDDGAQPQLSDGPSSGDDATGSGDNAGSGDDTVGSGDLSIPCASDYHNDSSVAICLPWCGHMVHHQNGCDRCDCRACGPDVCPRNETRSVRAQSDDTGSGDGAGVTEEDEIHEMHGETLCSWANRLRTDYPARIDYADADGVQTLWNLYEQNVFSMKTDLIPCTQSCGLKTARMFKFMRGWAQPTMNGNSPAYSFHDNGDAPEYFVGDFAGQYCDPESLPDGRCNGSQPLLPKIDWNQYKVVEMTRWNVLDRCLMDTPFAKGITEDPSNDPAKDDANIVKGDLTMDQVLQCIEYASAQRDADTLRSEVFAGDKVNDWLTLYYETCATPSQTQACVDAAVAHVTRTTKIKDALEMDDLDSKAAMLDESSRRRWRRTSVHPLESRRRWHPSAHHMQTLAAQWSTHVQRESAATTKFVNGVLVQGSNPTAVNEVVSTPGANVNISTEAELVPKSSSNATEDVKVIVTVDNVTESVGPNKNITTSITNTTVVVVPHGYGFHGVTHRSIRHGTMLELAAADAEHAKKSRATRWIGVSNAEELSAGLIHGGFATYLQPIYCFAFPVHTEGEVVAKYLALLPDKYVVPGSDAFGKFDAQVFEADFTAAVDSRTHSLMAFGSFDDVSWVETVRAATKRPLVLLSTMRDVIAHRVNLFYSDETRSTVAANASAVLVKGMMLSWIFSEDYPQEAQLQSVYGLNETLRNLTIDQVWGARNTSAIATGADADANASVASVYLGPVGDHQNVRRTLCVFAHTTALPIPWTLYQSDEESPRSTVPSEHLDHVDDDIFEAMVAQEDREFFYVARALDAFEAFAEMYGCLAEPTEEALRPSVLGAGPPEVGAPPDMGDYASGDAPPGGASEPAIPSTVYSGGSPSDYPIFYFHHVPKSGGTTLSDYFEKLPEKYIVPGSQRSERFDEDIFRAAEHEVAARMNVLIAYSHMNSRTFSNIIINSTLEPRDIKVIFLMRDTLAHRISFFHEMVGPDAHDSDQESLDLGKTVHRPFPDIKTWYEKDDDFLNANFTWLNNVSALTTDTMNLATMECIKGGACRNPPMRSNQLLALYKLNQQWGQVGIHDMFEQVHATEPLETCSRWNRSSFVDKDGGRIEPLFRYCPNATARVSIGIIGHLSMMRETLCLINRKLGIPVGWDGVTKKSMNWRFKKLRPMDSESSFNSTTAYNIISRESREVMFTSKLQAHLMDEAIDYGCVPPAPASDPLPPPEPLPALVWEPEWEALSEYVCVDNMKPGTCTSVYSNDSLVAACLPWCGKMIQGSDGCGRCDCKACGPDKCPVDASHQTSWMHVAPLGAVDPASSADAASSGDAASGVDGDAASGADPASEEVAVLSECNPEKCLVMPTGCSLRPECRGCLDMCDGSSPDLAAWSTSEESTGLSIIGKGVPMNMLNLEPENRSSWRSVNVVVRWSEFEPSPDEYDWKAFDSLLLDIAVNRAPLGVGITFLSGPYYFPQWLFESPFDVTKYVEVCAERSANGACARVDYSVPNYHDVTYLNRYKRVHQALAAKLQTLREINPDLKILYMQMSVGFRTDNRPMYFDRNRTLADYSWTNENGQPIPIDAEWGQCGGCDYDARAAPQRNKSLDPLWCPSGTTDTGLFIYWKPAFEEYARDLVAFMYDNVYASLRQEAGLRLMVTKTAPSTFVRVILRGGANNKWTSPYSIQSKERMEEVQLFPNDWLDTYAPGSWLMRDKEGLGYGLAGERTRVANAILNIFAMKESGPVRARAQLDKVWCWTGQEGDRGQIYRAYVEGDPVAPSCLLQDWQLYAMTMWTLTIRIDYWNIPLEAAKPQLLGTSFAGVWRMLNRYSGVRWGGQSPGAWIGFRDGLDVLDVERFPESEFGALPDGWRTMSKIQSRSNESKAMFANRQRSICKSLASFGCLLEIDETTEEGLVALDLGNGTNDVAVDAWRTDYGMFMQREDVAGSAGYWWQGPEDQIFGRYARGFAHPQATIQLMLDQGLWGGLPLATPRNLTLRIVFLDNSIGQFYVGYDALDGPRGWTINTTGTLRWIEIVRVISDGRFARRQGSGPKGADVWLRDMSSCREFGAVDCVEKPTLFDSVEVVDLSVSESALINGTAEAFEEELANGSLDASPTPPELLTTVLASPPPPPAPPPPPYPCGEWCDSHLNEWKDKCVHFWECAGCDACLAPSPPPPQPPPTPLTPGCIRIPEGKKLAVAGVWVDLKSSDNSNTTDIDASTTVCEFTLSLMNARSALTDDKCVTEDQVEILVMTDTATLPANTRAMYEDAGFVIKDVTLSPAMQQYRTLISSYYAEPTTAQRLFVQTLKLALMWDLDYAAVVVTDTDQFVAGGGNSADIFNLLLDPEKPALIYHSDPTSPINAGFIAARPSNVMYELFAQAIANGFNVVEGWGGTYDAALLYKIATASQNYVAYLNANPGTTGQFGAGQYAACQQDEARWCFIGHDEDQGLLAHMLASVDSDGNTILSSVDYTLNDELHSHIHARHFAGSPKPYDVYGVAEKSENGVVSTDMHSKLMFFWAKYVSTWSDAFDNFPPVCNLIYACRYQKTLPLDNQLATDNADVLGDGTGMAADRQALIDGLDASTCDVLVPPPDLSGGDDEASGSDDEDAPAPSSPDYFSGDGKEGMQRERHALHAARTRRAPTATQLSALLPEAGETVAGEALNNRVSVAPTQRRRRILSGRGNGKALLEPHPMADQGRRVASA